MACMVLSVKEVTLGQEQWGWMVMGWRMLARHGAWELKLMEAEYFHSFKWYLGWGRGSLEWGQD